MSVLQMNSRISGWIRQAAAALAEHGRENSLSAPWRKEKKERFSLLFKAGE